MNLNQITIPVLDLSISIPFYQKLGLRLIVHTHDAYARFECIEGDATLSLHRVEKMGNGPKIVVYFEEEDLEAYVKNLMAKGIQFDELPNDKSWLWKEAHLKDPDGNQLIIYMAGVNRKNPPWAIPRE